MAEKNLFFRRIFPLWFNSKLKKDCGFQKPNFPKNFFVLIQPGDQASYLCLKRKSSRACAGKKSKSINFLTWILQYIEQKWGAGTNFQR